MQLLRQRISQLNLIKQKLGKASLKHNLTSVHTKMVTWYGYPLLLTHEWKQFIISIGFALEQTSVIEKLSQILGSRTPLSSIKYFFFNIFVSFNNYVSTAYTYIHFKFWVQVNALLRQRATSFPCFSHCYYMTHVVSLQCRGNFASFP